MTYQIVVAGDAAPYLTRASWSKQKQLAISSVLPSTGNGVSFSPDGSLCAVAHNNSPYLTVYNTSNWSKVAISSNPPSNGYGVSFSPDGSLCAVAHAGSPFLTVYNTSDWSKVEHPFAVLPALSNLRAVAFHAPSHSVIRGSVRDVDNNPAARTVRIYERSTGEICATTTSDPVTGDYSAKVYEGDVDYDAHFLTAPGELLNDLFFARVRAGEP